MCSYYTGTYLFCKAPGRDENKLRELLNLKEKENEQEATHIEDTQGLVPKFENP
jgi:hypothetical protein